MNRNQLLGLLGIVDASPACSAEAVGARMVGRVEGTDAVVAVVASEDRRVVLYTCGGAGSLQSLTRWFAQDEALQGNGDFELSSDGWTATGNIQVGVGAIESPSGESWSWTARAADDGHEGLYSAHRFGGVARAVVFDSPAPLVQGAWLGQGGEIFTVIPIYPVVFGQNGIAVRVDTPPAPQEVWLDTY